MLLVLVSLQASEYYAKAEPKELFSVKSSVNGEVIFVNDSMMHKKEEIVMGVL